MKIKFRQRPDSFRFHVVEGCFTVIVNYDGDDIGRNQSIIISIMELLSPQNLRALRTLQMLVLRAHMRFAGHRPEGPPYFNPCTQPILVFFIISTSIMLIIQYWWRQQVTGKSTSLFDAKYVIIIEAQWYQNYVIISFTRLKTFRQIHLINGIF